MYRPSHARSLAAILTALCLLGGTFAPLIANAQANVCELSDAACDSPKAVGGPCPCLVPGATPPVIPGICISVNTCQATPAGILASITEFAAAHPIITAGIAAGGIFLLTSLLSGGGGSSQPSDTGGTSCTSYHPTSDLATLANDPCATYVPPGQSVPNTTLSVSSTNDQLSQFLAALNTSPQGVVNPLSAALTTLTTPSTSTPVSDILASSLTSTPSNTAAQTTPTPTSPLTTTPAQNTPTTPTPASSGTTQPQLSTALNVPAAGTAANSIPATSPDIFAQILSGSSPAASPGTSGAQNVSSVSNLTYAPQSVQPTPVAAQPSQSGAAFTVPGGLWGDIQSNGMTATILAGSKDVRGNRTDAGFYGIPVGTNPTTDLYAVCTRRPWTTAARAQTIPPLFFDVLCLRGGY